MTASSGTVSIGPDNWHGATPRKIDRNGRRMRGPAPENSTFGNSSFGAAIFGADASRKSFDGGLILIGILAGAAEFGLADGGATGEGKGVGTGDPL